MKIQYGFAQHRPDDLCLKRVFRQRAGGPGGDCAGCLRGLGIRFSPDEKTLYIRGSKGDGSHRAQHNCGLPDLVVAQRQDARHTDDGEVDRTTNPELAVTLDARFCWKRNLEFGH